MTAADNAHLSRGAMLLFCDFVARVGSALRAGVTASRRFGSWYVYCDEMQVSRAPREESPRVVNGPVD